MYKSKSKISSDNVSTVNKNDFCVFLNLKIKKNINISEVNSVM